MNNNILTHITESSVFISGAEDEEEATAAEGKDVAEADIEAAGMVEATAEEETGVAVEGGDSLKQTFFSMVLVFAKIGLPPKEIQRMCQGKGSSYQHVDFSNCDGTIRIDEGSLFEKGRESNGLRWIFGGCSISGSGTGMSCILVGFTILYLPLDSCSATRSRSGAYKKLLRVDGAHWSRRLTQ